MNLLVSEDNKMNKYQKFKNFLLIFTLIAFVLIVQVPAITEAEKDNQSIERNVNSNLTDVYENIFIPDKKLMINVTDIELEISPGEKVKTWAFNNTVPGPPLRFTEGEKITIEFVNNSTFPHTLHFHGIHDDKNDGVFPVISPGQSYLYNITAEPAGALMYHCHTMPVSDHIRMGMYGIMVVDPKRTFTTS